MIRQAVPVRSQSQHRDLPEAVGELQRLGRALAKRAAALLGSVDMPFLAITFRKGVGVRLIGWDADFRTHDLGGLHASRLAQAVEPAAATFLGLLARRWPPEAIPDEFGVLTDGTGLLFSPLEPSPLALGWLETHAAGRLRATPLLPPDQRGAWMLIQSDQAKVRTLH